VVEDRWAGPLCWLVGQQDTVLRNECERRRSTTRIRQLRTLRTRNHRASAVATKTTQVHMLRAGLSVPKIR